MRGNCLASKLMGTACRVFGSRYLHKLLGHIVLQLVNFNPRYFETQAFLGRLEKKICR